MILGNSKRAVRAAPASPFFFLLLPPGAGHDGSCPSLLVLPFPGAGGLLGWHGGSFLRRTRNELGAIRSLLSPPPPAVGFFFWGQRRQRSVWRHLDFSSFFNRHYGKARSPPPFWSTADLGQRGLAAGFLFFWTWWTEVTDNPFLVLHLSRRSGVVAHLFEWGGGSLPFSVGTVEGFPQYAEKKLLAIPHFSLWWKS